MQNECKKEVLASETLLTITLQCRDFYLFIYLFIIYHLFVFLQMTLLPGSAQKTYGFWADIWFTCRLKKL